MWTEYDYLDYQRRRGLVDIQGQKELKLSPAEKKESQLQRDCEEYLTKIGAWWLHLRNAKRNKVGVPDLLIVYHGKVYGIELKSRGGKATKEQMINLAYLKAQGATTGIARTFEEFRKILEE